MFLLEPEYLAVIIIFVFGGSFSLCVQFSFYFIYLFIIIIIIISIDAQDVFEFVVQMTRISTFPGNVG